MASQKTKKNSNGDSGSPKTKKGSASSKETLTFAQRVEQRLAQENVWEQYNSEAKFNAKDMADTLKILAQQTFPTDAYNGQAYQEALIQSLVSNISPEVGIKDFWKAMGEAGAKTTKIENGHLNFYNAKNERMDITAFTQPIVFEAHSSFYKQRQMEREKLISKAQKQLSELISEIKL